MMGKKINNTWGKYQPTNQPNNKQQQKHTHKKKTPQKQKKSVTVSMGRQHCESGYDATRLKSAFVEQILHR